MFMNYSDEELEKQYTPSLWSPYSHPNDTLRDYICETVRGSFIARGIVPGNLGVSYGKTEDQKLDIFGEKKLSKGAPIFMFVHGGYWIAGSRIDSAFYVKPLYEAGILSVVLGYELLSDSFTLPELIIQIQRGIKFVLEFAQKRGSRGVYLCGHSAGAHLIATALSSDPPENELYQLIRGLVLVSGIYDLNPLLKTSNAKAAHITNDIADFCSPMNSINTLKNNINTNVTISILAGEHDSPAFREQSEHYSESLKNHGFENVEFIIMEGLTHYTIVQNLHDKDHVMTMKLIKLIKSEDKIILEKKRKENALKKEKDTVNQLKNDEDMIEDKENIMPNLSSKNLTPFTHPHDNTNNDHIMDTQTVQEQKDDNSMDIQQPENLKVDQNNFLNDAPNDDQKQENKQSTSEDLSELMQSLTEEKEENVPQLKDASMTDDTSKSSN